MKKILVDENTKVSFSFKKEERLCSKKEFDKLFADGNSFLVYPLKVIFTETEFEGKFPVKVTFAVSKKNFKKAVVRNKLKRKMREVYRLNKHLLYADVQNNKIALAFIYIAKDELPYNQIATAVEKGIKLLPKKLIREPEK